MKALVLSGGGAFGAYQLGAVQYLAKVGRRYDMLCGVSVGALNAGCLAQHATIQAGLPALEAFWKTIRTDKVYRKRPLGWAAALWHNSIFDSRPLSDLVLANVDVRKLQGSGVKLRVGAVCWDTGEYRAITERDPRIAWWIMASASYPVFFLPIKIDGQLWTDGGLRHITPIREAVREGATEVDVVICEDPTKAGSWAPKGENAVPGFLFRAMGLMLKEVADTDLQVMGISNPFVQPRPEYAGIRFRVVHPTAPLAGSSLEFNQADITRNMQQGYRDAMARLA